MTRFSLFRVIAAAALATMFSLVWNGLVHGLVLAALNQALAGIGRHPAERSVALGVLLTLGLATLFVTSLAATARLEATGRIGWRSGLRHGLFFALAAGLLVDLNQYLVYPLPAPVPVAWFVAGLFEFCIAGWLAARVLGAARG